MSEEAKTYQIIVRQVPADTAGLEALLKVLQGEFGLEVYTARQRLIGPGLAMFGKGPRDKAGKIAELLHRAGLACWMIEPVRPAFVPDQLRSLEIRDGYVDFTCRKGRVRLERGAPVVAVLADVSGELNARHLKRMMAQNTYRGHSSAARTGDDELIKAIYQGRPVFDFYLFDGDGQLRQGVRVFPGKFNHAGLGERAGLSSILNLDALRVLVEEYAGDYRLHTDFGLGFLPECPVEPVAASSRGQNTQGREGLGGYRAAGAAGQAIVKDDPLAAADNLGSLTRYGWLVAQLQGAGRPPEASSDAQPGAVAGAALAALTGQPALAAVLGAEDARRAPGLGEVAGELREALSGDAQRQPAAGSAGEFRQRKDLPPPPDRPDASPDHGRVLLAIGGAVIGVAIAVGGGGDFVRLFSRYGMATGLVPAMAAAALFWSGFSCIVLKRRVENTPTSKVRSLAMGMVEVHGQARRIYALVAPMTQSACAWYRLRKYRKDKNNRWKLVREINSSHVPFQIDDGTGRVTVDPCGAAIKAKVQQSGYPGHSPLTFSAFDSSFGDNEKWVEDLIYEGTSLYVLGYAQPLREEKPGLRERTMEKLRNLKLDARALHRYDTNGDGVIDQAEWEAARSDAEQEALREHLAGQGERRRQEEHVVIARPPQRRLPFIVAEAESEAHLAGKYGWLGILLLAGGAAALALALYQFLKNVS